MVRIKKYVFFVLLLAVSWYIAQLYTESEGFQRNSEKLIKKLGADVISSLEDAPGCKGVARIDSVSFSRDWMFSKTGSGKLLIAGSGQSAVMIEYTAETVQDRVYVAPRDSASIQASIFQFAMRGCR